jgi:hypothetical protein
MIVFFPEGSFYNLFALLYIVTTLFTLVHAYHQLVTET